MANGIEKRRFKRMKADLSLNVSSLFKQDISLMNMRLRLKLGNNFKDLTDALAFTPSHPVTFYDDNDSSVQYVLNIQYKDGSS